MAMIKIKTAGEASEGTTRGVVGRDFQEHIFTFIHLAALAVAMRSTTVEEAVGGGCKEELLRRPLVRSDGVDDVNTSDSTLLLPFGGIPMTVVPLAPAVPPAINLR